MKYFFSKLYDSLCGVGRWALFFLETLSVIFRQFPSFSLLRDELFEIGVLSIPVVAITGFSTGLVMAAQSFYQFADKGLASATGLFVMKAMLTEVGPVLTAFMITGRVGSSMCALLGSMQVTEQIDALKSMSINPLRHLVAPRFLASLIMVPLLTILSAAIGIYGGYLLSIYVFGMAPVDYFAPAPQHISSFDLWIAIIKSFVFGFFISTIACYKGMTVKGGAAGVGRAITHSVVISYSVILIVNFLLTIGLHTLHLQYREHFR